MQIFKAIIGLLFVVLSTVVFSNDVEVTETEKYTYERHEKVIESEGGDEGSDHEHEEGEEEEEGEDNDGTGEVVDAL
jgi:hypothetical protein